MHFKICNLLLLAFLVLLVVPNVSFVNSQTPASSSPLESWRIHRGDSNRFDIIKATAIYQKDLIYPFDLQNNTFYNYIFKPGDQINVKVTGVNASSTDISAVSCNVAIITSNGTLHLAIFDANFFIRPGFSTFADAQSYYNQTLGNTNIRYSQNSDSLNITEKFNNTITTGSGQSTIENIQFFTSFNWKTGWINYVHNNATFSNETIDFDFALQREPTSSGLSTLFSYVISFLEFGSFIVVVATIVILALSYYSFMKVPKSTNNSQSFTDYLKNRFSYRKKEIRKPVIDTDKALETIESILEENKDNAE